MTENDLLMQYCIALDESDLSLLGKILIQAKEGSGLMGGINFVHSVFHIERPYVEQLVALREKKSGDKPEWTI